MIMYDLSKEDINYISDTVIDICKDYNVKYDTLTLSIAISNLTEEIIRNGIEFGFNGSVVADSLYKHLKDKVTRNITQ